MKNIAVILIAFLSITSCKKIQGDNTNLNPANQTANDYMSTKAGSWWLFGSDDGTIFKRMATGLDTTKNGLLFSYYESQDTTTKYITPEYYGKNLNKYVSLLDMDGTKTNYVTMVLLKDTTKQGDSWNNTASLTYSGIPVDVLISTNVVTTTGTLTINGKTYNNVVESNNNLQAKLSITPSYTNCGYIKMWFEKGVGIIKQDVNISVLSFYSQTYKDSLLDYHIEQ